MPKKIHDMVLADRRVQVREIVDAIGISYGSVVSILNDQLGLRKLSERWVPSLLSIDHKRNYVTISKDCLELFNSSSNEFLMRFVTVYETLPRPCSSLNNPFLPVNRLRRRTR